MNRKTEKLIRIIKKPSVFFSFFVDKFGKNISSFFKNKSFYLQGQMDINPLGIWHKPEFIKSTGGFYLNDGKDRNIMNLEPWDTTRRDMLILLLRMVIRNNISGSFAEVGVYKGHTAKLVHKYAPERNLYLFDTFAGFSERGTDIESKKTGDSINQKQFSDTSVEIVKKYIEPNENVFFYKGYFPDVLPENFESMKFAFVHLDADLYDPTINGLRKFYDKMSQGGIIVVHDYNAWIGARTAVDEFFKDKAEKPIPMPDKSGSAIIIKQ
jgi:O-methyltransferase